MRLSEMAQLVMTRGAPGAPPINSSQALLEILKTISGSLSASLR